jgi:hypothetical protein
MPIYSTESIKKYPWLYKYDDRSLKKRCFETGHRFKILVSRVKRNLSFVKVCKRTGCNVIESISGSFDKNGHWEPVKRSRYTNSSLPEIT